MKITSGGSFEIGEKRFYMPGTVLSDMCPKCGAENAHDFGDSYLSYPMANLSFDHRMTCDPCNHEWTVRVILEVKLKLAKKKP